MNRYTPKAGLGASSIMLILVTLCLTVFSVLSLVSASSDQRLSQTALVGTAAYYAADGEANRRLAELDERLLSGGSPEDVEGIAAAGEQYFFTVEIDESRLLVVEFKVEDRACLITGYRVENPGEWRPQEGLKLYQ